MSTWTDRFKALAWTTGGYAVGALGIGLILGIKAMAKKGVK
jgi:hypothetical protein